MHQAAHARDFVEHPLFNETAVMIVQEEEGLSLVDTHGEAHPGAPHVHGSGQAHLQYPVNDIALKMKLQSQGDDVAQLVGLVFHLHKCFNRHPLSPPPPHNNTNKRSRQVGDTE